MCNIVRHGYVVVTTMFQDDDGFQNGLKELFLAKKGVSSCFQGFIGC